jgi:hypothetical protein
VADTPTSITDSYGVGPIVAACVLGYFRDIRRFGSRDQFVSYNGTAPIEVSSGDRKTYRLSRRGNRQLNHAIHIAAVSQISHGSEGRAYYQRKRAEAMTGKCALRALKRKISDTLYQRMLNDLERPTKIKDPGGRSGNDTASSVAGSHPDTPALRTSHSRAATNSRSANSDPRLRPRPAPARRQPRRSAAGVQVEPPGPGSRAWAGTTLTPAITGRQSKPRSRSRPAHGMTRHPNRSSSEMVSRNRRSPRSARSLIVTRRARCLTPALCR